MKRAFGGTLVGFIVGVVFGLAAALAVAVYVTKVPIPFVNKGQSRSAEQDQAETKKNKDWDPNAPLYGKNPAKVTGAATGSATAPAASASGPAGKPSAIGKTDAKSESKTDSKADSKTDNKTDAKADVRAEMKPAVSADPLGDLAKSKMAPSEPFTFFVQVGAYRTSQDAEGQRAKLSLTGIETKISEREQSGSVVYRVRVGPFDKKDDAERAKEKLDAQGLETALVRVQR